MITLEIEMTDAEANDLEKFGEYFFEQKMETEDAVSNVAFDNGFDSKKDLEAFREEKRRIKKSVNKLFSAFSKIIIKAKF